jgi:hypothetical protein
LLWKNRYAGFAYNNSLNAFLITLRLLKNITY